MGNKQEKKLRKLYSKSMSAKAWYDVKIIYAKYKKMLRKERVKTILLCISVTINICLFLFIII